MFFMLVHRSDSEPDLKSPTWRRRQEARRSGVPIHPALIGHRGRGGDPEEAGLKALNDEDDYVSRVSHSELEFMSSLNSARFLPCSLH